MRRHLNKLETVSTAHYVYPPLPHLPNPISLETFLNGAQSGWGSNIKLKDLRSNQKLYSWYGLYKAFVS